MWGVIESFDPRRGDGSFLSATGESLYFHCVDIADGSRDIEVGARARGIRRVGHRGRDEVRAIVALESS
jgi:hypothetical protein